MPGLTHRISSQMARVAIDGKDAQRRPVDCQHGLLRDRHAEPRSRRWTLAAIIETCDRGERAHAAE